MLGRSVAKLPPGAAVPELWIPLGFRGNVAGPLSFGKSLEPSQTGFEIQAQLFSALARGKICMPACRQPS